jgi:hypothetical protein
MMLKKAKITRHFFIFSTSIAERINQKIQHLTFRARQAYYERNYREVATAGQELTAIESATEYGQYFLALAESQQGKRKSNNAKKLFQHLADSPNDAVRAASMLALGLQAYRAKDYKEARCLIKHACEIADRCGKALITSTMCRTSLAAIHSDLGDYRASISLIHESLPAIYLIGQRIPAYLGMELNNYAYELNRINKPEYASQVITIALNSPYSKLYPEWSDTKSQIDAKLNNVTDMTEYRKKKSKFTESSSRLDVYTKRKEDRRIFGKISLAESSISCLKIDNYFNGLEKLICDNGSISIESYLCSDGRSGLINAKNILRNNLLKLETLITESNAIKSSDQCAG